MTRRAGLAGVVAAALLVACSSERLPAADSTPAIDGAAPTSAPTARPAPPPPFTSTVIVTPDGEERCVLVAATQAARSQGLMGVTGIDPWAGMLFVFDSYPAESGFWMKDTLIPLDIAFVERDGTVVDVQTMEPCPAGTDCPRYRSARPYAEALEVEAGNATAWGIREGQAVARGAEPC